MDMSVVAVTDLIEQLAVGGEGAVAVAGRKLTVHRRQQWEFECLDEDGARRCLGGPGQVAIHLKDLLSAEQPQQEGGAMGGSSTVEPEELEGVVALNEIMFVYVVGGGLEPLIIWPGQIRSDVVAAGGHSIRGIESMHRVRLDSGLLARMKALNDETEGAVADLFAAIHAAGMAHQVVCQGVANRR